MLDTLQQIHLLCHNEFISFRFVIRGTTPISKRTLLGEMLQFQLIKEGGCFYSPDIASDLKCTDTPSMSTNTTKANPVLWR
jgi:hypothetical protein